MQERCRVWCKITILCDLIEQNTNFSFLIIKIVSSILYFTSFQLKYRFCHFIIFFLYTMLNRKFARCLQTNIHSLEMPFFKDHSWDLPFLIKSPQSLSPLFIKMSPFWSRDYAVLLMYRVWRLKDDAILRRWSQKTHTCRRWSIISSPSPVV